MHTRGKRWVIVVAIAAIAVVLLIAGAGQLASTTTTIINYTYANCSGATCSITVGQRVSNFALLRINANGTASGYEWRLYPVASLNPYNATLRVGDSVGYSCDGSLATLVAVNRSYATFALDRTKPPYGCPI